METSLNDALLFRALQAHQAGNLAEAARLYGEVLRGNPRHFQALFALADVYYQSGRLEESMSIVGEALKINPRSPEAFFLRGCALRRLNRLPDALSCFERAVSLKPNFVEAETNRGICLMALKRNDQALESFDRALALDRSSVDAWNNRGCVLHNMGLHAEAVSSFGGAIARDPRFINALVNRGSSLIALKRFAEAAKDFERALAINPEIPYARGNLALCRMHGCDWRDFESIKERVAQGLRAGSKVIYPFVNVVLSPSMADQLQCARLWVQHEAPPSPAPLWRGEVYRREKIRVAYVSADFHAHATSMLMAGVFEEHDRNRFEVLGLSLGLDDGSEMRARVRNSFDRFFDLREKSDAEIAWMMRQSEIDIAVDLKGYTKDHRSGLFAFRPSPIQVNYLGYPGTMGAPYIDYIIADKVVIPEEHTAYYTEKIAYLPDSYQCNDSKRTLSEKIPSRKEAGLPEKVFVFCCFNSTYKIAPDLFALWMRLLHEIPDSVLWLLEDNPDAMRNLKREAEERGIKSERLVFAPKLNAAEHFARHNLADLFLDTQPYGAHTTASDALWAGLPVLTVLGPTFASRVAASLLAAVGLREMITETLEAYEAAAMRLARDANALAALRSKLARGRDNCTLFDAARFTRNLEAAYMTMWQRWQHGQAPESFSVQNAR